MAKISVARITAVLLFLLLIAGALFCVQILQQDISAGKYFSRPEELRYNIIFLSSYGLIIFLILRYGYYLAINRVNWKIIKDDFLYLLNRKYFSQIQWLINVLLFWLSLSGFIYSLAISAMKGNI